MADTPSFNGKVNNQFKYGEAFVSTTGDIEYTVGDSNTHTIHHCGLIKSESSDDLSTYSLNFDLTPTQFADMALNIDYKTMISLGRVETTAKVVRGPETWNAEQVWSYSNENNHLDIELNAAVQCAYRDIEYLMSTELKTGHNFINGKFLVRLAPGKDHSLSLELNKNQELELTGRVVAQAEDELASLDLLFNKIADGHYTAQVSTRQTNHQN